MLREAVSKLVAGCAAVGLRMIKAQHMKVHEALDENLRHPHQHIQRAAVAALGQYTGCVLVDGGVCSLMTALGLHGVRKLGNVAGGCWQGWQWRPCAVLVLPPMPTPPSPAPAHTCLLYMHITARRRFVASGELQAGFATYPVYTLAHTNTMPYTHAHRRYVVSAEQQAGFARYVDAYLTSLHDANVAVRRGYAQALGALPRRMLAPRAEEVGAV